MQHQRHRPTDLLDLYIGAKRALEQAITALNAGAAGPRQRIRCRPQSLRRRSCSNPSLINRRSA